MSCQLILTKIKPVKHAYISQFSWNFPEQFVLSPGLELAIWLTSQAQQGFCQKFYFGPSVNW